MVACASFSEDRSRTFDWWCPNCYPFWKGTWKVLCCEFLAPSAVWYLVFVSFEMFQKKGIDRKHADELDSIEEGTVMTPAKIDEVC